MLEIGEIKFIEAAVEVAKKSVLGGTEDPLVGALLVRKGIELGRACRGELEPGDHAEYTLLEKKLKQEDVTGGTLYTTLEPCTSRGKGKIPCAERIWMRRISRVVVGILDPDQPICGRGVRALRKAGIEVDFFPNRYMMKVEDQNRDFIKDREDRAAKAEGIATLGVTLYKIELEQAEPAAYYKFKLRLYWMNDGDDSFPSTGP